jgi:hypothetical protein
MAGTQGADDASMVTADEGTRADTVARFRRYVDSHHEDARIAEDVPDGLPMRVHVARSGPPISRRTSDTEHLVTFNQDQVDLVLEVRTIRETIHGASLTTIVYGLLARGVLDELERASEPLTVRAVAERMNAADPERNLGYLYVAFRALALQTWLTLDGRDAETTIALTEFGRCNVALIKEHRDAYAFAIASIDHGKDLYRYIRTQDVDPEIVAEARELVDRCIGGWGLPPGNDRMTQRALRHLRRHLDGRAILPYAVAMGMPVYEFDGGIRRTVSPGFFDAFGESGTLDVATMTGWHPVLLQAGIELFTHLGIFEARAQGSDPLQLTPRGRAFLKGSIPAYCGAPVSYSKMFMVVDDMLFGDPDPLGMAHDNHVDRAMNIWAIENSVSVRRARTLCSTIIRRVFDETPLDQQPAGVVDMGCGAGGTLLTMARYIVDETARGKHLAEYPLTIIGADYSDVSRAATRDALAVLDRVEGVTARVVFGDVTDPRGLDTTIRELRLPRPGAGAGDEPLGATDFLHTQFHLAHDRSIRIRELEQAEALIRDRLRSVNREALRFAIEQSMGTAVELPESPEALYDLTESQFTTSFAMGGRLLPALCAAADLIAFLERWGSVAQHGLVIVDLHAPRPRELLEEIPADPEGWMRIEKISLQSWIHQALSDQYPAPYVEHAICCVLAGLDLVEGRIYADGLFTAQVARLMERGNGWYRPMRG